MDAHALIRLNQIPRIPLALLPTPLLPAPGLQAALRPHGPRLLMKLDDWTGVALGGNKVRKLEFFLGDMDPKTDVIITCGGPQSNHCRVTAAVAAQLGKKCVLVVNGQPPDPPTGNALLMRLFGAEVRPVPQREDRAPAMEEVAGELSRTGRQSMIIPLGASTPLGSLGYVRAAIEVDRQMDEAGGWGTGTTWIFLSSSSCGTLAGLALGLTLLGKEDVRLVGVSADETAETIAKSTRTLAAGAAELLGSEAEIPEDMVIPEDRFIGAGYGLPTRASDEAASFFGKHAGVILDPVYTAKAGAAYLEWIREGRIPPGDTALFWHTGGSPALFA